MKAYISLTKKYEFVEKVLSKTNYILPSDFSFIFFLGERGAKKQKNPAS